MRSLRGRRSRRGQSVVEYLVVAAAIIAAIIVIGPFIGGRVNNVLTTTVNKYDDANSTVDNGIVVQPF